MLKQRMTVSGVLSLVAIAISLASLVFTDVQTNSLRRELALASLRTRPYVKYIPVFDPAKGDERIDVTMISENLSAVPATILYSQLRAWIANKTSGNFMRSVGPDVLYEHKGGEAQLPPITGKLAEEIISDEVKLTIATCVVYGSISPSDPRRWVVMALYRYGSDSTLPLTLYTRDLRVASTREKCDSAKVRSEWLRSKERSRMSSGPGFSAKGR